MYKATLSGEEQAKPFLGRYQLQKKLAIGGMAELYLAQVSGVGGFQKQVVVKRILPQLAESEEFFQMFLDEARIAATLQHPNIVQVYDSCEEDGEYFMAMEYLEGTDLRTLRKVLADRSMSLPWEHALFIIVNIAAGLHYAHEKCDLEGQPLGIVHRDVTPHNIFFTREGGVKLVDFGIAKAQGNTTETAVGTLKGKLAYMSPEQARGKPIDRRSDIYSLGIILYELTTGRRIYRGVTELELMNEIADDTIRKPSSFMEYPSRLEDIVFRCLSKDQEKRYQSARELQADLEDFARLYRLMFSALSFASFLEPLLDEAAEAAEERWKSQQDEMPIRLGSSDLSVPAKGSAPDAKPTFKTPTPGPRRSPSVVAEMKAAEGEQLGTPRPAMPLASLASEFGDSELTARVPEDMLARLRMEEKETAENEKRVEGNPVPRSARDSQNISLNLVPRKNSVAEGVAIVAVDIDSDLGVANVDADLDSVDMITADLGAAPSNALTASEDDAIPTPIKGARSTTVLVDPLEMVAPEFNISKPNGMMWILGVIAVLGAVVAVLILSSGDKKEDPIEVVPEKPQLGTVKIKASGPADVWFFLGRTPVETKAVGNRDLHRIRVEHDGYQTVDTILDKQYWQRAADGQQYVEASFDLAPKNQDPNTPADSGNGAQLDAGVADAANQGVAPRGIRLSSTPSAANAWLFIGKTPNLQIGNIPTDGEIRLRVEVAGAPPLFPSVHTNDFDAQGIAVLTLELPIPPPPPPPESAVPVEKSPRKKTKSKRKSSKAKKSTSGGSNGAN